MLLAEIVIETNESRSILSLRRYRCADLLIFDIHLM